jgi:hypothetical protein
MNSAARIIGLVCVTLTIILWIVTLTMDPTQGSISATVALTAIVTVVGALSLWS